MRVSNSFTLRYYHICFNWHRGVGNTIKNRNSLQQIPMFLPVMRGTLSLPAMRDPEVLERLQPNHILNMCTRLQVSCCNALTQSIYIFLFLLLLITDSLKLLCNKNCSWSKRNQLKDQRLRSRYWKTLCKNDRASKTVRELCRSFLSSSSNFTAAEPL